MANTRSAAKQARASLRRAAQNKSIKSRLHTLERKFLAAVAAKKAEDANAVYRLLTSALDKAAKTKVIHRNNASRKKSRLSAHLRVAVAKKA
ncbi:MAG TPA: 30S ribosomal protein S20 [Verrucomicrobiae bacterium]|nr:30S ribosomal protein S20 [Verrucomicrobiae bacterium]